MANSDIEARLRALEDQFAIMQAMASYGPAVDSGLADATAGLWTEDGVYDAQVGVFAGRAGIKTMVQGPMHQSIIAGGSAHVIGLPVIKVSGDRAVSTCYARLYRHDGMGGFRVWRVTANRWEWQRTADGWQVTNRVNRVLDGSGEARDLLAGYDSPAGV
jgi:hypothetical protein